MLSDLFKSKEEKIREKVEEHIKSGISLLAEKFHNKAMIEFDKAMELNREEVYPRLVNELQESARSGDLESAIAIGLNLLKEDHSDYELANRLGNYAREIGDYNQAEALYKSALKVKKNYEFAFYNLAATLARVDLYDESVKASISQFDTVTDYVLPEFPDGIDIAQILSKKILQDKEQAVNERLQILGISKEEAETNGQISKVAELTEEIEKLTKEKVKVLPEDVIREMLRLVGEEEANKNQHLYNLGLYALMNKLPKKAIEAFEQLGEVKIEHLDLLRAIALAETGKLKDAISQMIKLLGKNEFNRYNNINIGLMYRKGGKQFLAIKYLIKTASLLKKSNGLYSMNDLIAQAHQSYEEGKLRSALEYYKIASTERSDYKIWEKIGDIYVETKKYDDAIKAYRKMLAINPKVKAADEKLREIHDYYVGKGEVLLEERKFNPSASYFEKALSVIRDPETIKSAAGVYKQLQNHEREKELMDELFQLQEAEKQRVQEIERQKLIKAGKEFLQKRNFLKAIENLEGAFRMKLDKNVYLQLSKLYKGLKKHDDLHSLTSRWEKMLEHQEKVERYERDREKGRGQE